MDQGPGVGHRSQVVEQTDDDSRVVGLVLAESYPILLEGMDRLFRSEPGFKVLACCTNGEDALRAVQRHHPDVLVLDLRLPGRSALTVLREVVEKIASTRVVLNAENPGSEEVLEGLQRGARGLVLKSMPSRLLVQCVRKVHRGATWFDEASAGRAIDRLLSQDAGQRDVAERLTRREFDVLRMAVRGESNKDIADKLTVSEGTVKAHLHHIYEKLNVKGRLELVLYSRDKGLLSFRSESERPRK